MKSYPLRKKITISTVLLVTCAITILAAFFLRHIEDDVMEVINAKTVELGNTTVDMIEKSISYGVPFQKLRGLKRIFRTIQNDNPELAYLFILDKNGNLLYSGENLPSRLRETRFSKPPQILINTRTTALAGYFETRMPIIKEDKVVGQLHMGVPKSFVRDSFVSVIYDQMTVMLVTILIILELSGFLLRHLVETPLQALLGIIKAGKEKNLAISADVMNGGLLGRIFDHLFCWHKMIYKKFQSHGESSDPDVTFFSYQTPKEKRLYFVRPPLFLAVFANALSLAFFPGYIAQLMDNASSYWGLSQQVAISLPISAFMLCWALSQPLAGPISSRFGQRNTFIIGCIILAVGLVLSGLAQNMPILVLAQSIGGIGYGLIFINATAYVVAHTDTNNRAQGMAVFLSAFFSGILCGAAMGGILADRIGHRTIFFLGCLIAVIAALFIKFLMTDPEEKQHPAVEVIPLPKTSVVSGLSLLAKNIRFLSLTILIAIPAKMCLTGLMNYMTPMYLASYGVNQSFTGRVLMSYGLIMIVAAPLIARAADHFGNRSMFVVVGSLIAGIGVAATYFLPGIHGALLSISLLGLAHAIGISSALALVPELCRKEISIVGAPTVLGIYRLIERAGSIAGPIVAGFFITFFEFEVAYLAIGLLTLAGMIGFTFISRPSLRTSKQGGS